MPGTLLWETLEKLLGLGLGPQKLDLNRWPQNCPHRRMARPTRGSLPIPRWLGAEPPLSPLLLAFLGTSS